MILVRSFKNYVTCVFHKILFTGFHANLIKEKIIKQELKYITTSCNKISLNISSQENQNQNAWISFMKLILKLSTDGSKKVF